MNILFIPLDERSCNYRYPGMMADMTDNIRLIVPPAGLMGSYKKPADVNRLWSWIFSNVKKCSYAILSIDTLIYGNIINSRIHHKGKDECLALLGNLKEIKRMNPDIEIHAYNLVARVANCNLSTEDPDYWADYGKSIWEYSYYLDKKKRGALSAEEREKLLKVEAIIPKDILADFLGRRATDRFINLKCIDYLRDGVIDYFVVPKDDTAEYGYAALDQAEITKRVYEYRLMDRVMIYPGADEVGCVLLARVFNKIKNYTPKIYVRYSSTLGAEVVPLYEDRPLNEGIKAQITSIGGVCVATPQESDFMLAVNSPGAFMAESGSQFDGKDITYYSHGNLHELIRYIGYYLERFKKPVAVADVAFSNGADNEFMLYANKVGLLEKISAYGGWNTSQNTIGMCMAHADIESYYASAGWGTGKKLLSSQFLARKIVEDWLFQALLFHQMAADREKYTEINEYDVSGCKDRVVGAMQSMIADNIHSELKDSFLGKKIVFENLRLPWNRVFDIDFDLKLV